MDHSDASILTTECASPTDPEALARLRRFGGDKLLHEMIALYLATAPERLAAAKAGVESGDRSSAELALHSLKSSSAQLGAARLGKLSERGEIITRGGTLDGVADIITEMEAELAHAVSWLERVRDGEVA
jgi:two-component system, sensor histidine kinase and response regulator